MKSDPAMRRPKSTAARPLRRSIVLGLVVALLALAAGVGLAATQQRAFTAESVLVVLPKASLNDATSAAFYETMSRGQIVGTFAEVADNPTFERQSADKLALTDAQRKQVSTTVSVVPDTSVILVRVTAGAASVAEQLADATAALATTYLAKLSDAYRTQIVHSAQGSATTSGLSPTMLLILGAAVGLSAGVAVQQVVYHLMMARRVTVADDLAMAVPPESIIAAVEELSHAGRR